TLGTSSGTLTGDLAITGTASAPRFEGGLNAQFDRLVVAPIGLDQDNVTVAVSFQDGTRWTLDTSPLYAESLTARSAIDYCGVTPRVIGSLDLTKKPYLSVALSGEIPALDPKRMTLNGCIGMKDYPVLDTRSLAARIDGSLTLDGTVAQPAVRGELKVVDALLAPELASKSIRPIGLPLDVTLVRGDPVPPAERPVRNPFKTGVLLDVTVTLPKDVVRVEPSLMQPYGEVRALLYPHGELRIRTVDGELSLLGTIEVPKETVFLYGKTFTVDPDSRLVFNGDMANDPQLFFTARYNIADLDLSSIGLTTTRDSEVVVRVTGTPTEPRLEFTSSPSMDETNILSVIALGVPAGGGEALGDAVQSQLLTAVMGMATLQFARDFQQRLALDVLRIEARSADPTDTRLTVGKRLSEDLLLSYYLNLSAREGEDRQSGSLEYRLTRYLSLLARGGDAGDVGLELNFRFADTPPTPRTSPRRRERPDNRPRKDPEAVPAPR
ncbi:MAG TPA: translocation/assembly module TamB domain-containing protein, partial [Myxococcota bacterium]|nr:translocation/assembly module TamB domain-containing protein [Myxococcota bacterium]